MRKKCLSFFLAICLCVGLTPALATGEDSSFQIEDGVLVRYTGSKDWDAIVVIPEGVTEIARSCSLGAHKLIVLPQSLEKYYSPYNYTSETQTVLFAGDGWAEDGSLVLNPSTTKILDYAYKDLAVGSVLVIPEGVTYIGDYAFTGDFLDENYVKITDVYIPESVTYIGERAFSATAPYVHLMAYVYPKIHGVEGSAAQRFSEYIRSTAYSQQGCINNGGEFVADYTPDCQPGLVSPAVPLRSVAAVREKGFENFGSQRSYDGRFADVPADSWYHASVSKAYELGLMQGQSTETFAPSGNLTHAEALAVLCNLHCTYMGGDISIFTGESPWYQPYLDYALDQGLIHSWSYGDGNRNATRRELARLFGGLPTEMLEEINTVQDWSIPGIESADSDYDAIYRLYRAGILTGIDIDGNFAPESSITRAELAAIAANIADPGVRHRKDMWYQPVTLYSDQGKIKKVPKGDMDRYLALNWRTSRFAPDKSSLPALINSVTLDPVLTHDAELDKRIGDIFSQIFTDGMTTYDKVLACYNYIIGNTSYMTTIAFPENMPKYDSTNDRYAVYYAKNLLFTHFGACDDYASAFQAMTRRIGLESYILRGETPSSDGGWTAHAWNGILLDGTLYLFDTQLEDTVATNNSRAPDYRYWFRTDEQSVGTYREAKITPFSYYERSSTILYSDSGATLECMESEVADFLRLNWREAPFTPPESDCETLLNSASLFPIYTHNPEVDDGIDTILAQIHTPQMSIYEKLLACYDYVTKNMVLCDESEKKVLIDFSHYGNPNDGTAVDDTLWILRTGTGTAEAYANMFHVMAWRLGVWNFLCFDENVPKDNGRYYWVGAILGKKFYFFDVLKDGQNASNGLDNHAHWFVPADDLKTESTDFRYIFFDKFEQEPVEREEKNKPYIPSEDVITLGEILALITQAVYPDELAETEKTLKYRCGVTTSWFSSPIVLTSDKGLMQDYSDLNALSSAVFVIQEGIAAGILAGTAENFSNRLLSRREVASILYRVMEDKGIAMLSDTDVVAVCDAIPDVTDNDRDARAIAMCYKLGILTGVDETGAFNPDSIIDQDSTEAACGRLKDMLDGGTP